MTNFEQFKYAHLYYLDLCTEPYSANEIEQSARCATKFTEFQARYTHFTDTGKT